MTDWCLLQFYGPFHTSARLICKCEIRAESSVTNNSLLLFSQQSIDHVRVISIVVHDRVAVKALFFIMALYEQCAFCTAPTVLLSFYENKQKVSSCRHLLYAFTIFSLMHSLALSLSPTTWQTCQVSRAPKWISQC